VKTIPAVCRRFLGTFKIFQSPSADFCLLPSSKHRLRGPDRPSSPKRNQSGRDYERFARFFAGQGIPEPILQETYRALEHKIGRFRSFPIHPQDSLWHVYGLDCYRDDTLADLMSVIRAACPLRFYKPVSTSLPCDTVADLVYLMAAQCDSMYQLLDRICPSIGGMQVMEG